MVMVLLLLFFCFIICYYFFFNDVLMWKIVEASKVSVLYLYIDYEVQVNVGTKLRGGCGKIFCLAVLFLVKLYIIMVCFNCTLYCKRPRI